MSYLSNFCSNNNLYIKYYHSSNKLIKHVRINYYHLLILQILINYYMLLFLLNRLEVKIYKNNFKEAII